ncbi:hypothetical protein HK097_005097 [Rhizophlyctis rosea]|uniref:Uncharacterized protein n=1 Tax=Rhizophlyctis rosea TaxID=64517 RepID=A0AAD5X9U7_9FUNG|nr:hypothetical protein HK097_005097 [Rhizophlyctis rosea]
MASTSDETSTNAAPEVPPWIGDEEETLSSAVSKLCYRFDFSRAVSDEVATAWNAQLKKWFKSTPNLDADPESTARSILPKIASAKIGKPFLNILVVLRILQLWPHEVSKMRTHDPVLQDTILKLTSLLDTPLTRSTASLQTSHPARAAARSHSRKHYGSRMSITSTKRRTHFSGRLHLTSKGPR